MQNYIFSTIAAACAVELILEFAPFIKDATLKKYLRYVFALVLSLCIVAPFSDLVSFGEIAAALDVRGDTGVRTDTGYIYFEDDSFLCESDEWGVPKRDSTAACDMYIRECCFGIIRNAKSALSSKFSLELSEISIGISFDLSDVSDISLICAYVNISRDSRYLKSDVRDYLENTLGCRVYGTGVSK